MIKIAITGNIACGKSQVEKILSDLGYTVFDSDKIGHDILETVDDFYGYDVFSEGKIDRQKLGSLVFSNPELKKKLENITHPRIKSKIIELFKFNENNKFIFISVPLLYEAKFDDIFDKVILVTTDPITQLERLMTRNNLSKNDALARINSQFPQTEKEKLADYIIKNNSSIENLNNEVRKILKELQLY